MKLTLRLMLAFALVALFAAGLTAWLGYHAASTQFEQVMMADTPTRGMGQMTRGMRGKQVLEELRNSSALSFVLATVVALLVGAYLAYRFVHPVQLVTRATSRYGHGERDIRVPIVGNDELTELARTFNHVTEQLASREAQDRRMVADIAHEFRTPLTVLKGELEALGDGLLESSPETFERLVEEVDLLERLVRDLRLISVAEAGQLSMNLERLDLSELVQTTLRSFMPRATRGKVTIEEKLESAVVTGDFERLKQVIYNLLENAIRHTPEGGLIKVTTKTQAGLVLLEIQDSGLGIPTSHLLHIFERFYRVDAPRSRELGGSGLGLAIVKAMVEAHGGTVQAINAIEGGAIFQISLPLAR